MNRKGSAIAEAVMIFPMVILSVAALIFMMTYFYTHLNEQVNLHIILRSESGKITENVFYGNVPDTKYPVYRKTQQIYSTGVVNMGNKMILRGRKKEFASRKYLVDEALFIRMNGVLGDKESGNE